MSDSNSLLLQQLNQEQQRAVLTVNGRLLILAGAGSGKTLVLTTRMAYLIKNLGVPPKHILGLTFTNKAAAEMRHRIASSISQEASKEIKLCTFHSFCMEVLRSHIHLLGYTTKFSLYDEQDVQRLINVIVRDVLQTNGELPSLASTMAAISKARSQGHSPDEMVFYGKDAHNEWHKKTTREIYRRFQASMRAYNAVDFDNLLWLCLELFLKFPDVLEFYQERFRYIMIDEYQDTNPVQYRLASLLAAKYQNLCVVGDDDQSIYGWRGADIKNILDFDKATVIKLEQNYRSTSTILNAANAVIKKNQNRHDKALWSQKGEGRLIEIFHAPNEIEEAKAVVMKLIKIKEANQLKWGDCAILYRSNALSRHIESELLKQFWKNGDKWIQGIPYEIFGGLEFYERREVKDLCAYLRTIVNPSDQEAILRIINLPRRGIGEDSLDAITSYNRKNQKPVWEVLKAIENKDAEISHLELSAKAQKGILDFIKIIEEAKDRFSNSDLAEALKWLLQRINYQKAIDEEVKRPQMRDFKWENVQEFVSSMAEFSDRTASEKVVEGSTSLEAFLSNITLNNRAFHERDKGAKNDRVHLMTFHSAKGLEFPACFLVGMEDHIIPHEKSLMETGIEEERRLMYVAITRAKQFLTMSFAKSRKRMGQEGASRPSRFLFDIPRELVNMVDYRI